MHILKHIRIRSMENPCIQEICDESAFHEAHSNAMCLSEVNAEILVKCVNIWIVRYATKQCRVPIG